MDDRGLAGDAMKHMDEMLIELADNGPLAVGNENQFQEALDLIRYSTYFAKSAAQILALFIVDDPKSVAEIQYALTLAYLAGKAQGHASAFQEMMEGK